MDRPPNNTNGTHSRIGAITSKYGELFLAVAVLALGGAAGWQALESRVSVIEAQIGKDVKPTLAALNQRLRELEIRLSGSVSEADVAVLRVEVVDIIREIDTLYVKAEKALAGVADNRARHEKLVGKQEALHK